MRGWRYILSWEVQNVLEEDRRAHLDAIMEALLPWLRDQYGNQTDDPEDWLEERLRYGVIQYIRDFFYQDPNAPTADMRVSVYVRFSAGEARADYVAVDGTIVFDRSFLQNL